MLGQVKQVNVRIAIFTLEATVETHSGIVNHASGVVGNIAHVLSCCPDRFPLNSNVRRLLHLSNFIQINPPQGRDRAFFQVPTSVDVKAKRLLASQTYYSTCLTVAIKCAWFDLLSGNLPSTRTSIHVSGSVVFYSS